jgi:thiaminase/transcriptional activator TenA
MAALAPCVLGYGEIGARLAQEASSESYAGWIGTYADDDYQRVCRDVGALVDGAVARRLGAGYAETPRWPRLARRFADATRLEVGFWDMGLRAA